MAIGAEQAGEILGILGRRTVSCLSTPSGIYLLSLRKPSLDTMHTSSGVFRGSPEDSEPMTSLCFPDTCYSCVSRTRCRRAWNPGV